MKTAKSLSATHSAPQASAAGGSATQVEESNILLPVALQWLMQYRVAWIGLLWLLSRGALLFLVIPNPDAKRYFDTSGSFLKGMVPYAQFVLEYPPGALILFTIPRLLTNDFLTYTKLFAAMMMLIDIGIVAFLWHLPRLLANPTSSKKSAFDNTYVLQGVLSSTLYLMLTCIMYRLTFERYDLVCSLVIVAWLANTLRGKNLWLSDLLLALGIWIKLITLPLLPVYLAYLYVTNRDEDTRLGATMSSYQSKFKHVWHWARHQGIWHLGLTVVFTLLLFLPFVLQSGYAMTNLFVFHSKRGIQLETLYAGVMMFLHNYADLPLGVKLLFGASQLTNPWAPVIASWAAYYTLLMLAFLNVLYMWRLYRSHDISQQKRLLLDGTLCLVLAFIVFNKVLSPQYLLWFIPLAPLVLWRENQERYAWLLGVFVACGLSSLWLTFYYAELVHLEPMAAWMLNTRNALLLGLMLMLLTDSNKPVNAWVLRLHAFLQDFFTRPFWRYVSCGLVMTWVFCANLSETTANDIWIQLRSGADIVKTHTLPYVDSYSATVQGLPFIAHEWLSGLVFYGLVEWFGGAGLSFLAAFVALFSFILLYYAGEPKQRHNLFYLTLMMAAFYLIAFRILVRPHIFTILAQSALMLAIERWRRGGRLADLLWLVPMQIVWVNLHAAALFGPALMGMLTGMVGLMVLVPALQRGSEPRVFGWRDVKQLAGITMAMALMCLANPYGTRLLSWSIELMNNDYARTRVWEWTPSFLWANTLYYWLWLFVGGLVLLWGGLLVRIRTLPIIDAVFAGLITFLAAGANRFIPDFGILAFPIIARSIQWLGSRALAENFFKQKPWLEMGVVTLLICNTVCYGYAHSFWEHRPMVGWGFGGDMPYQEVDMIKRLNIQGTIYNEYSDGSLIIHTLSPQVKPVIDSRIDLYPRHLVDAYDMAYVNANMFEKYLERYHINLVLLYEQRANPMVLNLLMQKPDWALLSRTNGRVLFYRRSPTSSEVLSQSGFGH